MVLDWCFWRIQYDGDELASVSVRDSLPKICVQVDEMKRMREDMKVGRINAFDADDVVCLTR